MSKKAGGMELENMPINLSTPQKKQQGSFGFLNANEMSSKTKREQILINDRSFKIRKKVSEKRDGLIIDALVHERSQQKEKEVMNSAPKYIEDYFSFIKDEDLLEDPDDPLEQYEEDSKFYGMMEEQYLQDAIKRKIQEEEQLEKELDELTKDFGSMAI